MQVPVEYVKNNEIVLNVGFEATSGLKLGNEFIEFKARFGGVAREIVVPVDHVIAIYARENGQGMAFPVPTEGGGARRAATARPRGPHLSTDRGRPGRGGAGRTKRPQPPEPPAAGGPRSSASSSAAGLGPREKAISAGLAQLVEHPPCKRKVFGSIPKAGTSDMRHAAAGPRERRGNRCNRLSFD